MRIHRAAVVIDPDGGVAVQVLRQDLDRGLAALSRLQFLVNALVVELAAIDREQLHAGGKPGGKCRTVPQHIQHLATTVRLGTYHQAERIAQVEKLAHLGARLEIRTRLIAVAERPAAARDAPERRRRIVTVQPAAQEARPVIRLHRIESLHNIFEAVGFDDQAAVVDAVEGAYEIIQRSAPARQLPDGGIDIQPDQLALIVEVNVPTPTGPVHGNVIQQLRLVGSVLQVAPDTAGPAIQAGGRLCKLLAILFGAAYAGACGQDIA